MDSIIDPELQEGKFDWMDREKATKPVSSLVKLMDEDESGRITYFKN